MWPLALDAADGLDCPNGKVVVGRVDGKKILLGNRLLMESENVDTTAFDEQADQLRSDGATVIFAAAEGQVCGLIAIADPIKETTKRAIAALHKEGLRVVMLTGDN